MSLIPNGLSTSCIDCPDQSNVIYADYLFTDHLSNVMYVTLIPCEKLKKEGRERERESGRGGICVLYIVS